MLAQLRAHAPAASLLLTGAGLLILLLLIRVPSALAAEEGGAAALGRQLYFSGQKDGRDPLTANVGAAAVPVPATALPCAGCHGRDGQGRPEGGVRPSDITWLNLSREYGGVTQQGRRYEAYDEDRFLRAVSEGIDSAGNRLDSSMPRYNITRRDARDLIAYLRVIQDDLDPGVFEDAIVLGTLQPSAALESGVGEAMTEVVRVRFDEVNRQGGIYGKQLRLEVAPFEDRQSFVARASEMIDAERVFALVNVFSSTADETLNEMAEDAEIPSIGPYTQFPGIGESQHVYTFYLHGGLEAQIGVLAKRAAEQAGESPALVLYRDGGGYAGIAATAAARLRELGLADARALAYPADGSGRLADLFDADANPAAVMFLGFSRELVALAGDAALARAPPRLYLPGFFVGGDILNLPRVYAGNLEMAYTTVPNAGDGAALNKFREFMVRNRLDYRFLNARLYAFGAAEILIEGLKRAGKRVTRKKLVDALEALYGFDAGLNQPVSYTTQRRVALNGAYIVELDAANRRLLPTENWIDAD